MEKILNGVHRFRTEIYPKHREQFVQLSQKKQKPTALFITCADSRVDPNLITGTDPGDLFIVRNAGNLVPPYGAQSGGEIATVEYALSVLGIRNIILCGHSQCGAMQAIVENSNLDELPGVRGWFAHAESTRLILQHKYKHLPPDELLVTAVEENVLVQLNNLSTHPSVAARLAMGELNVYGWYYDIGSGKIRQYHQSTGTFKDLDGEPLAATPLPVRAGSVA
jgi:carbonic anhydrase